MNKTNIGFFGSHGMAVARVAAGIAAVFGTSAAMASQWVSAGNIADPNVTGLVALADGRALVLHGTTSEIYDPITNSWGNSATLHGDHGFNSGKSSLGFGVTLTLLQDGKVLLFGREACSTAPAAEIYDPTTNSWSVPTPPADGAREGAISVLLDDGRVLVSGGGYVQYDASTGSCGFAGTDASLLYDAVAGTWTPTADSLNFGTLNPVKMASGEVMVLGTGVYPVTSAAEIYNPSTGTWRFTKPTLGTDPNKDPYTPNIFKGVQLSNGQVVAMGECQEPTRQIECSVTQIYTPSTDSWSSGPSTNTQRADYPATLGPSGEIIVSGGVVMAHLLGRVSGDTYFVDTDTNTVETLSIGNSKWSSAGTLPEPRAHHFSVTLKDGRTLIAGGSKGSKQGSILLTSTVIGTP